MESTALGITACSTHPFRTIAARLLDDRGQGRRRSAQERMRGRTGRRRHRADQERHRHVLWCPGRRDRHDRAPHGRRAGDRSGARRVLQGRLPARAHRRMGHARHARHMQRGLQFRGYRQDRAGAAGTLPENPRAYRHAGRTSDMERGVGGSRHRRRRPRARVHPQRSARQQRPIAAGRGASHAGDRVIADPARGHHIRADAIRGGMSTIQASWNRSISRPA